MIVGMRLGSDRLIADVGAAIESATSVVDACQSALDTIAEHSDANTSVLLPVHDRLRAVAANGAWHVFSSVYPGSGVVGRTYTSGLTRVIETPIGDPDYIELSPNVVVEICTPVVDGPDHPIGVINMEWSRRVDVAEWRPVAEQIARMLGRRIRDLGGPPPESRGEKLLRHGFALTTAATEAELLAHSLYAARDVSGLDSPVLILNLADDEIEVDIDELHPTDLAAKVAAIDVSDLRRLSDRARLYGASYTIGDPATLDAEGYECLTSAGVRTMISIPVGLSRDGTMSGGCLLVVSDRATRPDPETVNLIALLAAQAWSSRERIQTLANLRELAVSDPLTGLRHHGSFSERLADAIPGHTAVFAIDIDSFKNINDTYGHQAGDQALIELAQALAQTLRAADDLYRIGGDEFAVVVDVQRSDEALGVAERLVGAARGIGHTISVGVAIHHEGETPNETLSRADAALYVAKRTGRDGVRLAS
jgi:diguanylate cyclase (GGDEF)-like protein